MNIGNVLEQSRFTKHFIGLNSLRFHKWIFEQGMLFSSELKWWGEKGKRGLPHNGLDLRFYEACDGSLKTIGEGMKVPIIYEGRIVKVVRDFLGFSIFASHDIYFEESRLLTVYGHVLPTPEIFNGGLLGDGSAIATVAEDPNRKVPTHLHISIAFIPKALPAIDLVWELLDNNSSVRFLDPRCIIQ